MKRLISMLVMCIVVTVSGCSDDSFTMNEYNEINQKITSIRRAWFLSRPRMNYGVQPYNVFLVIDTNIPAIWLEREGRIDDKEKCQLPSDFQWEILHITPEGQQPLKSPVRLKQRSDASQDVVTQELIFVQGGKPKSNSGMHFTITDSGNSIGWGKMKTWNFYWGPKPDKPDAVDKSIVVTPGEYAGK